MINIRVSAWCPPCVWACVCPRAVSWGLSHRRGTYHTPLAAACCTGCSPASRHPQPTTNSRVYVLYSQPACCSGCSLASHHPQPTNNSRVYLYNSDHTSVQISHCVCVCTLKDVQKSEIKILLLPFTHNWLMKLLWVYPPFKETLHELRSLTALYWQHTQFVTKVHKGIAFWRLVL